MLMTNNYHHEEIMRDKGTHRKISIFIIMSKEKNYK